MAIADKVTSITNHLIADYEELENVGAEINDDKNIENIAYYLQEVYDNLPKTTGEDTNLSLTTLKGKMNIIPKGDTQQTTYTGKNKLPNNLETTQTKSGVTATKNEDGSITLNGTSTASTYFAWVTSTTPLTIDSGTYTASWGTTGQFEVYYQTSSGYPVSTGASSITSKTFTLSENTTFTNIRIAFNSGVTFNNFRIPMQLETGSSATNYEPYVGGTASPNPTYPQDIEVVTGTQEVKAENVNLLPTPYVYDSRTINGITFTINDDYSISASGTATGNATFVLLNETSSNFEDIRKLLLNNSCTLSGCPSGGSSSSYRLQLYGRGSAGTGTSVDYGSGVAITNFENTSNNFNIAIFIPSGTTISTPIIFKPQLEKRNYCYTIYTTPRTNTNSRIK